MTNVLVQFCCSALKLKSRVLKDLKNTLGKFIVSWSTDNSLSSMRSLEGCLKPEKKKNMCEWKLVGQITCFPANLDFWLLLNKVQVYLLGQLLVLGQVHEGPAVRVLVNLVNQDDATAQTVGVSQARVSKRDDLRMQKLNIYLADASGLQTRGLHNIFAMEM